MIKINKLILFIIFLTPSLLMAQTYPGEGTIDINGGIGIGHNLTGSGGVPINASLDYGINENISVGGYLGYLSSTSNYGYGKFTYSNFILGARGAYHHELVEDVDTYGGLMLGYNIASAKWSGTGSATASSGGLVYNVFVGGRYHFADNIGAFAELGFGVAILQLGVTYRL